MKNIVLCGIGGQGTVLASKLIAAAAMKEGKPVQSAETIGMAQRGGSVFSHLRVADEVTADGSPEVINSPLIAKGTADIIIGFEPGETVRMLPYLKEGGQVITSSHSVMPVTAALTGGSYSGAEMVDYLKQVVPNLMVVDTDAAIAKLGNPKVMNVLLLGYALESGALGLSAASVEEALKERLPEKLRDLNLRALNYSK